MLVFLRMVRDVFHTSGSVALNKDGCVKEIILNRDDEVARQLKKPLKRLLKPLQVSVILGESSVTYGTKNQGRIKLLPCDTLLCCGWIEILKLRAWKVLEANRISGVKR